MLYEVITIFLVFFALSTAREISVPLLKGVRLSEQVARGDLSVHMDVDRKDEVGMLATALKDMVARLRAIVSDVKQAADNVTFGSREMSSGAEAMSATSEEMSQGTAEQAAAAEDRITSYNVCYTKLLRMLCSLEVARSLAETLTIPLASISKVTSI